MILGIDPSGNFHEGKGTTGLAFLDEKTGLVTGLDEIKATDYATAEDYWQEHVWRISMLRPKEVVIEGFRLYGAKAKEQTHSIFETPMLIGIIRIACYELDTPLHIQYAHEVKNRWAENVLVRSGHLDRKGAKYYFKGEPTNQHKRDAMKHVLHYWRYKR